MRRSHLRTRRVSQAAIAALLLLCASLLVAVPLATGRTVEFTTTPAASAAADAALGGALTPPSTPMGVTTKTLEYTVDKHDKQALRQTKKAERLRAKAAKAQQQGAVATARIEVIQGMLDDAAGSEERLRAEIESRLVAQYMDGGDSDLTFLLAGSGVAGLLDRSRVLRDRNSSDARLAEDYASAVERLETLRLVLAELQSIAGDQAERYTERADDVDATLVAARTAHMEAPDPEVDNAENALDGTWYVMDGAFQAQLFLPTGTSSYDGGAITAARPATPQQIQAVIADKRIDLDASGFSDVTTGQIDGRVLDALAAAANAFGYVKVTSLKSDHGVYTSSGNVSAHSFGCAADIGTIGTTYITPGSQTPGGEVERAVRFFDSLGSLRADLAPRQVISLFDLGGSTLRMGDHGDHIHLGYAC
ncbi:MAG: Lytic transglycosylase catalytic [Thermoleophilia bacterium]|nr:Lytic transglycosylase catalytic [Thermoleophilia bacterium]